MQFMPINCNLTAPDIVESSTGRKAFQMTTKFYALIFFPFFVLGTNFNFYLGGSNVNLTCIQ